MNYDIKGPALKPDFSFKEDRIIVGRKEYFYDDITNIGIAYKATAATNGVIRFICNGKDVTLAYSKKSEDLVMRAVNELQNYINGTKGNIDDSGMTPEEQAEILYNHCLENGTGKGFNRKWGIKHFLLIVNNLMPKEKVAVVFIGLHNYRSATKHMNNFAYAITDKRIILAQQRVVGEVVQSISWNNINDIMLQKRAMMGIIEIDTFKERITIGVDRISAQSIFNEIYRIYDILKNKKNQQTAPPTPSAPPVVDDPIEKVKKLKELLDMGILTQEEFDQKKKELLRL